MVHILLCSIRYAVGFLSKVSFRAADIDIKATA